MAGTDPDGDPLTFSVVKGPSHGQLKGEAPNLIYTPDLNFSRLDSFTFAVSDGKAQSAPATVSISVTPVNDPPTAKDDSTTTHEDMPVTIDVLANDTELDDELLKISNVTQGAHGSVTIDANGTLTYTPRAEFHGSDEFTYTVSDEEGKTDTATVHVAVAIVEDPPTVISQPLTTATADVPYMYHVTATDPDTTGELTYSLAVQPTGMTIDPVTGLIKWTPTEMHARTAHQVVVQVVNTSVDSDDVPASGRQAFSIHVNPPPPKRVTLTVMDGYDQKSRRKLSAAGAIGVVQASDDKHQDIHGGAYISYDFSDIPIPANATIGSVAVCVEHFEDGPFASGKLQWAVGTNWPGDPTVWITTSAPTRTGKQNESMDSWDVTSFVDTPEKLSSLQLQIQNSDTASRRKTCVDHIHVVVEWDWTAPPPSSSTTRDSDLVRYE